MYNRPTNIRYDGFDLDESLHGGYFFQLVRGGAEVGFMAKRHTLRSTI